MPGRAAPRRARRDVAEESPTQRAVAKFGLAKTALREFMDENDDYVQELRRLIDDYNACIREAVHALKSQLRDSEQNRLVVGEFGAMKRRREWWDGHILANSVPRDKQELFLTAKTVYEVDVSKLEQLLRQGEIDADIARQAFHEDEPTISLMPGSPKEMNF